MDNCEYQKHVIGQEMDAGFDGGEFSSAYHDEALERLEPCGICPACLEEIECSNEPDPWG